jgi:GNAT superfamily N-acetyltransferase
MLADVHVTIEPTAATDVSRFLLAELFKSNVDRIGDGKIEALCVAARGATNDLVAGAYGELYWGWLNILVLWVAPALRRQGLGTRLLGCVETEALARDCHGIYLDTFSFQHPALYLRAGYEVFGTLEQFPNGHSRHFLRKRLHAA